MAKSCVPADVVMFVHVVEDELTDRGGRSVALPVAFSERPDQRPRRVRAPPHARRRPLGQIAGVLRRR